MSDKKLTALQQAIADIKASMNIGVTKGSKRHLRNVHLLEAIKIIELQMPTEKRQLSDAWRQRYMTNHAEFETYFENTFNGEI